MITPGEFMSLAERLAAIPAEAEGRSAVSRAYYGSFHAAKSLIEEHCGVVLPKGPEAHGKLQLCLVNSGSERVIQIGNWLGSLRDERNRADYRLSDSTFAAPVNVQTQLQRAKDIVALTAASAAQTAVFREAVREYASRILKLPLRKI